MALTIPPLVNATEAAQRLRAEPETFLRECAACYGPVFTVLVEGGRRITYVLDLHAIQPLLTAPQVDFSPVSRQSKLRFGLGGIVSTQEDVRALSEALVKSLRGPNLTESLSRFDTGLRGAVAAYATDLEGACLRTIQELARQTLMPAMVFALFGDGLYDERFLGDFVTYSSSVATRFAGSNPKLDARGVAAERALLTRLEGALERQETPVVQTLTSTLLCRASLAQEERLRTLLMLLWGSMVNLVPTSVWMYASVIRDPSLVEDLRRGSEPHLRQSIATETLRLYSRPNMYREIIDNCDLKLSDGRKVRVSGGDWIALFPRLLHHDEVSSPSSRRCSSKAEVGPPGKSSRIPAGTSPCTWREGRRLPLLALRHNPVHLHCRRQSSGSGRPRRRWLA